MTAVFRAKSGNIYTEADLALCDDAMHADFQMFTETGEPCDDIEICDSVWCPTPEYVAQFGELCFSAKRYLGTRFDGAVREGLNRYDDSTGEWFFVNNPSAMADMATTILNHIARMNREKK